MNEISYNPELISSVQKAAAFFRDNYIKRKQAYCDTENSSNTTDSQENFGTVQIYSHLDTDGLCAAAILGRALRKGNIGYRISILKQLKQDNIKEIAERARSNAHFLIFADFGTGQFNVLKKYMQGVKFIILDHHEPLKDQDGSNDILDYVEVNPHNVGIDGMRSISGAGLAYLFARELDKDNTQISYIALVGALGDMQNVGSQTTFIGQNKEIEKEAHREQLIIKETEPSITRSRSLSYALAFTLPVPLTNISGNLRGASLFLKRGGIKLKNDFGEQRTLADLSINEKKTLTSSIITALLQTSAPPDKIDELIVTNYLIKKYEEYPQIYSMSDLSTTLNACGRMDNSAIGISLLMTDSEDSINLAIKTAENYTKLLQDGIEWARDGNLEKRKSIVTLYGGERINENFIGVILSHLIFEHHVDNTRAVIGYADSDGGSYKLSARSPEELLNEGVNLSEAIRYACTQIGLEDKGGGHAAASGAYIPKDDINNFLEILDEKVSAQINNSDGNENGK